MTPSRSETIGRDAELERLAEALEEVRGGGSALLAVMGAPGIGKTTLLEEAARRAVGFTVLRARGYEAEADIPYGALLDILRPVLDRRTALPPVQARALGVALALDDPAPHEPFAVAAGVLGLLSAAAGDGPVLVLVDDLQWVDEASRAALLFAARRLDREPVGVLLALRDEPAVVAQLAGVELLTLGGLDREPAARLVQATAADVPAAVAAQLAERTGGNPLALVEVTPLLTPGQRAGREPLDGPLPIGGELERAFRPRIEALPPDARTALLLAAAMETDELATLQRALEHLGHPAEASAEAERAGLLSVTGDRVRMRHPLVRSAAYQLAADAERRSAHAALAAVSTDPRRRAWHLALATLRPDAGVADELDAAARDARERGGHAAAARAWDRAAELTADPARAGERRLAAAIAWVDAGHPDQALAALDAIDADGPLADQARGVRAQVELRRGEPRAAFDILAGEAARLEADDRGAAAAMMLRAAIVHMMTGDMAALIAAAQRARHLAEGTDGPEAAIADVLLGETYLAAGECELGDRLLAAREDFLMAADPLATGVEIVGMAGHSSFWIERWDRAEAVLDRVVQAAREASAVGQLVYPLAARSQLDFRRGNWRRAYAEADEAVHLARLTAQLPLLAHALSVLAEVEAGMGHTADAQTHGAEADELATGLGAFAITTYALRALGLDHLAHGRPAAAVEPLERATAIALEVGMNQGGVMLFVPDHVEALVRAGRADEAAAPLELWSRVGPTAAAGGLAMLARCEGLLAGPDGFEAPFERALELHAASGQPFEEARTALAFGERLRRARQRARAREPLGHALRLFQELGAGPWAARAEAELQAAGGAGRRADGAAEALTDLLTPGELQVALMAGRGLRNREVAASLFVSEKTVERHLTSIYRKLDVRSRTELAGRLGDAEPAPA